MTTYLTNFVKLNIVNSAVSNDSVFPHFIFSLGKKLYNHMLNIQENKNVFLSCVFCVSTTLLCTRKTNKNICFLDSISCAI